MSAFGSGEVKAKLGTDWSPLSSRVEDRLPRPLAAMVPTKRVGSSEVGKGAWTETRGRMSVGVAATVPGGAMSV